MANKNPKTDHLKKTQFKSGQSGNPNGRPKSLFTKIRDQFGMDEGVSLNKTDSYKLIEYCISLPEAKLIEMGDDVDLPAYLRILAKAIIKDLENGTIATVETIFNRVFGTPVSTNQIVGKDGKDLKFGDMSDEDLDKKIKKYAEKHGS